MYGKIKELAAAAIALQNKNAMDAALREIGMIADQATEDQASATGATMKAAAEQSTASTKGGAK